MKATSSFFLAALSLSSTAVCQFYPDSNASWCSMTIGPMDWHYVLYYMSPTPDTVIAGTTYKVITEHSGESGDWVYERSYYVRSDPDGKGYAYMSDSMAEYLTGDTAALAGDTLYNVLGWYDYYDGPCGPHGQEYSLFAVVIDSVVALTNDGITVHRQFVHIPCAQDMNMPQPYYVFWQAGMGTAFGPLLRVGSPMGQNEQADCANVAGVSQFGINGLPGGIPCCWPIHLAGVQEQVQVLGVVVKPNPNTGHFIMEFKDPFMAESWYSVYDAMGRLLYQRPLTVGATKEEVDLSRFGMGSYVIKFTTKDGVCYERVVLE